MFMKKASKILLIAIMFIIVVSNISLGFDISGLGDLDKYNTEGISSGTFVDMVNNIIHIIQIIGSIISVMVLIILGIKYMIGSIDERAEYKRTMMPYLVGAVLFFGIVNVVAIISNLAQGLSS